jgi:hypothetical protein
MAICYSSMEAAGLAPFYDGRALTRRESLVCNHLVKKWNVVVRGEQLECDCSMIIPAFVEEICDSLASSSSARQYRFLYYGSH